MLKFWWISKIEFWSEELVDGHQRGVLSLAGGGGGQLSGSVSDPF